MTDDKDHSSIISDCELFVVEADSFSRLDHEKDVDSGPKSLIFNAGTPIDRAESLEQLKEFVMNLGKSDVEKKEEKTKMKQGYFMGFLTKDQAEQEIVIPAQFATYYRIDDHFDSPKPPKDSNVSLNLFVCYMNTRHRYHHYPIVKNEHSPRTFFQLGHFDITKSSNEPLFTSIKSLLKHYTQFVYVDSITESGGLKVSVFPK